MKRLLISALVISLTSCGVVRNAQIQTSVDDLKKVCDFSTTPELAALKGKIKLGVDEDVSLKMLTLETYPDEAERKSIESLDLLSQPCRRRMSKLVEDYDSHMPEMKSILQTRFNFSKQILASLYSRRITFGQYNKMDEDNQTSAIETISRVESAYQARAQAQAANFANAYINRFSSGATYTSCTSLGNTTNCLQR